MLPSFLGFFWWPLVKNKHGLFSGVQNLWTQFLLNYLHYSYADSWGMRVWKGYKFLFIIIFIRRLTKDKHCISPCIQTGSRLPGTVWRGLIFFTTDRPDYHRMPPPAGDNHGWVVFAMRTGFALGHRASTFRACGHLITTAVAISITSPRVDFRPRNPTCLVGTPEEVPASVHTMWLPGKVPLALSGTPSERGVWNTRLGITYLQYWYCGGINIYMKI